MPINRRTMISATALAVLAAPSIRLASAQSWPSRPIELVVGFGPGGGTDILARTIAPFMEKHLGNNARIGVVNRPGSSGEIGFTSVATARPDGYTLALYSPAALTIPYERRARFNFESFDYIGNVVSDPSAIFVAPNSPFQTINDLVEFAKANPRRINIGSAGIGSANHLATLIFSRAAGIEMTMVPFPGTGPNRTALMGGHINASTFGIGDGATFVREGQLRILGSMASSRWDLLPDAPTMREQGIDVVAGSDRGLAAPAGTPAEIMDRLSDALSQAVRDPDFLARAREQALFLNPMPRAEYRAHLAARNEEIGELWRTNPWRT